MKIDNMSLDDKNYLITLINCLKIVWKCLMYHADGGTNVKSYLVYDSINAMKTYCLEIIEIYEKYKK